MKSPLEPTALDAAKYVGIKVVEYGCYTVIGMTLFAFWVVT